MKRYLTVMLLVGFALGSLTTTLYNNLQFKTHVKKAIFDECFQYYAVAEKANGISKDLISTCWDKADSWVKEIKNK